MKKKLIFPALFIFNLSFLYFDVSAKSEKPDTVNVGIYITSIHDIDFKQKEYTVFYVSWF